MFFLQSMMMPVSLTTESLLPPSLLLFLLLLVPVPVPSLSHYRTTWNPVKRMKVTMALTPLLATLGYPMSLAQGPT